MNAAQPLFTAEVVSDGLSWPFSAGFGPARGTLARYDLGGGEGLDVEVLGIAGEGEADPAGVTAPGWGDEQTEPHYWLRSDGFEPFLGAESEITY